MVRPLHDVRDMLDKIPDDVCELGSAPKSTRPQRWIDAPETHWHDPWEARIASMLRELEAKAKRNG